ncbi:TPA: hypothetical protein ACOWT2_004237 [Escherichia coli]
MRNAVRKAGISSRRRLLLF